MHQLRRAGTIAARVVLPLALLAGGPAGGGASAQVPGLHAGSPGSAPPGPGAALQVRPADAGYGTLAETALRAAPDADAAVLGILPPGTAVRMTGVVSGDGMSRAAWLRLAGPDGAEGFVPSERVAEVPEREWQAWAAIGESDGTALRRFLLEHPRGHFAPFARARLAGGGPGLSGPPGGLDDLTGRPPPAERGLPARIESGPAVPGPAAPGPAGPGSGERAGPADLEAREPERRAPGTGFRDCADCPEMVVVPAGTFVMGPAAGDPVVVADELPRRRVTLDRPFAIGRHAVTVAEFAAFATESGHRGEGCAVLGPEGFAVSEDASWQNPGYWQGGRHPVACVSWDDAERYVAWLSARSGARYRLPSEAEWEYAARGGSAAILPWEDLPNLDAPDADAASEGTAAGEGAAGEGAAGEAGWEGRLEGLCRHANVGDRAFAERHRLATRVDCLDGHAFAAPSGSFPPNGFGLHDMVGNVFEWTADCWNGSYAGAPTDGRAWTESGDCTIRVTRGASWASSDPHFLRLSRRTVDPAGLRLQIIGLRVVRDLE